MDLGLKGRRALVTGASKGLGRLMDRFEFLTGDKAERRERRLRSCYGLSGAGESVVGCDSSLDPF